MKWSTSRSSNASMLLTYSALTLLLSTLSCVSGLAIDTQALAATWPQTTTPKSPLDERSLLAAEQATALTCVAANVDFINSRVTHASYFCSFYLSYTRKNSPFLLRGTKAVWNACRCIASATAVAGTTVTKTVAVASATSVPSGSSCSAYVSLLEAEYHYPPAFCAFYTASPRTRSSIPGISVATLEKACQCLDATSSSTSTSTSTTTTASTSTSTTTTTCKKNALPTSTGDFASALTGWTPMTSLKHASISLTPTGYDASGSAAVLTCTFASDSQASALLSTGSLALCAGSTYELSFKYKFPSGAGYAHGGLLDAYSYASDALLGSAVTGPSAATAGGVDSAGVAAGTWATYSATFVSGGSSDVLLLGLKCLTTKTSTAGTKARVVVDNVRVQRVSS